MDKPVFLGVGELFSSELSHEVIKTVGLGSCVALILIHLNSNCVGMSHIALPDSSIKTTKEVPEGYFADKAVPNLIASMKRIESTLVCGSLIAKLVGGSSVMDRDGVFNIGKENLASIRRILEVQGIAIKSMDVGGSISRSVSITPGSKEVLVVYPGEGSRII